MEAVCAVALTGKLLDPIVVDTSWSLSTSSPPGQPTVKDLCETVVKKYAPQAKMGIEIMDKSGALAPTEQIPQSSPENPLFLFFDSKFRTCFPEPEQLDDRCVERQKVAVQFLPKPLTKHWELLKEGVERTKAETRSIEQQLEHVEKEVLPQLSVVLAKIPLVEDPQKNLAELLGGMDERCAKVKEILLKVDHDLKAVEEVMRGMKESVDYQASGRPLTPLPQGLSSPELRMASLSLTECLKERLSSLKVLLRKIEHERQKVFRCKQNLYAVQKGVFDKVAMLQQLPTTYEQAKELAKKRLVLFLAAQRVINTLNPEYEELNRSIHEFRESAGNLLPNELLTGVLFPIQDVEVVPDPMTKFDLLDLHDDDQVSVLLQKLHLTAVKDTREQDLEKENAKLKEELAALLEEKKHRPAVSSDEVDNLKAQLRSKEEELKKEHSAMTKTLLEMDETKALLKTRVNERDDLAKKLQLEHKKLKEVSSKSEELEGKCRQLEEQVKRISAFEQQNVVLRAANEELEAKFSKMKNEFYSIQVAFDEQNRLRTSAEDEIMALRIAETDRKENNSDRQVARSYSSCDSLLGKVLKFTLKNVDKGFRLVSSFQGEEVIMSQVSFMKLVGPARQNNNQIMCEVIHASVLSKGVIECDAALAEASPIK